MNWARIRREPALPVAFFGICAALLGFVREQVIAARLGLSISTDAFYLALTVCTFLPGLINGASMGILAPYHARAVKEGGEAAGKERLGQMLQTCLLMGLAAIGILAVFGSIAYPFLAAVRNVEKLRLTAALAGLLSLAIPSICLSVVAVASLNVLGKYVLGGASTLIAPIVATTVLYFVPAGPWAAAGGLVLGLNLQAGLLLWGLRRQGVSLRQRIPGATWKVTLRDMGHLAVGALVVNISAPIIQGIVATHGARSTSTYNFGIKITTASLGLSALFFSTLLNPIFAARAAGLPYSAKRLRTYLWLAVISSLALSTLLVVEATPLIRLFLRRGVFSENDVALVAKVHMYAALQIPFYMFSFLMMRMVSSYQDTRFISRMSWVQMISTLSLAWPLHTLMGVQGLLLANALAYGISGACYSWRYRHLRTLGISGARA